MKKVAISGYFDPIHIGHLEYIRLARELGDYLIVIVNNDKQAFLKKGKSFMCEEGRVHDDKDFRREQEKMFSDEVKQFAESKYPEQELDITFHMPFITDVTLDMHSPNGYASPQVLVHFAAEVIRGKEVN